MIGRLAGTLLLLNVLVAVGPLARTVFHFEGRPFLIALGGYHELSEDR